MKLIPIYTWNKGVRNLSLRQKSFMKQPWAQGVLLLACVVIAMLLANLPFTKEFYREFLETSLTAHVKSPDGSIDFMFPRGLTIEAFINDILMVVFFFTVGLEIRREISHGELSSVKKALLPVIAAFGGVVAPALIYILVNHGTMAAGGWGIPTATDIAFAVCILSVLGPKVPVSLKVFLTALAIADDLIAILVVAIFYGGNINLPLLGVAFAVMAFVFILNKLGEKRTWIYMMLALVVWTLFYYSGIHSTMSGVVMALLIPSTPRYTVAYYERKRREYIRRFEEYMSITEEPLPNGPQRHCLRRIGAVARGTMPMTDRMEHMLGPFVNFIIMPIFALANAGVEITDPAFFNIFHVDSALGGVSLGIFLGLVLGKPIGITLTSFLAIKCKVASMPNNATWPMFFAVACLGGIGFTMSIFVDTLSFGGYDAETVETLRSMGKIAVLIASITAGVLGSVLISLIHKLSAKKV